MLCPCLSFLLMHGFEVRLAGVCQRYSQTFPVDTLRNAWRKSHFASVYIWSSTGPIYIYISLTSLVWHCVYLPYSDRQRFIISIISNALNCSFVYCASKFLSEFDERSFFHPCHYSLTVISLGIRLSCAKGQLYRLNCDGSECMRKIVLYKRSVVF